MTLSRRVVLATSGALGAVVVLLSVFAYFLSSTSSTRGSI